jgi:hypothetical protein
MMETAKIGFHDIHDFGLKSQVSGSNFDVHLFLAFQTYYSNILELFSRRNPHEGRLRDRSKDLLLHCAVTEVNISC